MFLVSKEIRSFCKLRPRGWLTAQSNSPSVPQKLELYFFGGGSYQYQALGFRTGTSYIVLVTGTLFAVPVQVVLGIVIDPILIKISGLNIEKQINDPIPKPKYLLNCATRSKPGMLIGLSDCI